MTANRKSPNELRSHRWYGAKDMRSFNHRARSRQLGYSGPDFGGKPKIGILNTWSDMNTCHGHFKQRVEEIKRGVWEAGGFPIELPVMSLSEIMVKPTSMLYRNFLAMEAEEVMYSHPIDGVVLMGGCDKTTPALLMAALTMDLPAIYVPAGPMLRGYWAGKTIGTGTDMWKYWADRRAGLIDDEEMENVVGGTARSHGTCMTMGTASTMMALAEVLGLSLPGYSSIPAVDSSHALMAVASGRRIVELVWEDARPSGFATEAAFRNAVIVNLAMGGSTNAIIHLVAMARRAGVEMTIDWFDEYSRSVPVLANIRPSGSYLMEDFYYAGGLRALMSRITDLLDTSCPSVGGGTLADSISGVEVFDDDVIRPLDNPLFGEGGTVILRGNLAPDGCVIKQTAADPSLHVHSGPAVVFDDYADLSLRIDDPNLDVTPDSVLVLRNAGPIGAPGMPEWGQLPIPKKLLEQGVRDMVRISDARMSGTAYGTCVLHVAPEAHVGGPLALIQDGDMIELNIPERRLEVQLTQEELDSRKQNWSPRDYPYSRGFISLHGRHVTQANDGCDYDFLHAGEKTPEPQIY